MNENIIESKKLFILTISLLTLTIIILLIISNTLYVSKVASLNMSINANPGLDIKKVNWLGTVEVHGDIPNGVRVYLLREIDYIFLNKTNSIPNVKYLDSENNDVTVENIQYLLIDNENLNNSSFTISADIYHITRPYAPLSLVAYAGGVLFIALLFIKASKYYTKTSKIKKY